MANTARIDQCRKFFLCISIIFQRLTNNSSFTWNKSFSCLNLQAFDILFKFYVCNNFGKSNHIFPISLYDIL